MRYFVLVMVLFFGLCMQAQAKVIIIASQGGRAVLYDIEDGDNYDPISEYAGEKPSRILLEHSFMPATACLLNRDVTEYVSAVISENTPRIDPVINWLLGEYSAGDKLFLLGYSAGAKFVIDVARELQNAHVEIDVDGMFLVDAVVFQTGYRNLPENVQRLAVYYQRNGLNWGLENNERFMGRELFWGPGARYLSGYPKEISGVHHQNIDNNPFVLYDVATKIKDIINAENRTTGTDIRPAIFTDGNHTHVIAPSYRCSKETNGPILCWESGTDPNEPDDRRNCWNAWKWYKFNGDVSQVADHHNDSGWITSLSRDYTCNEVYNSGGSSGGSGGSGNSDPGDEGQTLDGPDANVANGFRVRPVGGNWQEINFTAQPGQQLEASFFIKNKGDETIDYFEAFLLRSDDLNFDKDTDHSYGREEEDDDLDPGETDEKRRNFTAPTTPGTYYLYAYINRVDGENGGTDQDWSNNYSRSDDPPEMMVLVVGNGGSTSWDNLPDATKAAIFSIIFD